MPQIAATRRSDKSPRLHCCCDKSLVLSLSLRYVARIQTSLNLCDRSQRQNSVAATMIFTCHTRRFVAATCRGDVSQRFVAPISPLLWSFSRFWSSFIAIEVSNEEVYSILRILYCYSLHQHIFLAFCNDFETHYRMLSYILLRNKTLLFPK